MPMLTTHDLTVCGCCLVAIANADDCHCPTDNHPDGLATFTGLPAGVDVVLGDTDDWDGFSLAPCDGCGMRLAGERYPAHGLSQA